MASRNPRIKPPALTKTQALRQAKSAAFVKEYEQKQQIGKQQEPQVSGRRRRYPIAETKKVEFTRPAMTKTQLARIKHAEKFKQEFERKREQEMMPTRRVPRRPPVPISDESRLGRERIPPRRGVAPPPLRRTVPAARRALEPPIPERTMELARSMNAQVIQAEPIGEGPIDSIVIPPRAVNDNRTTIVTIPQPAIGADVSGVSQVANRSIQVISETLDEQDATEHATVQGKLDDLQQARRDFVMAVANVGGTAVQIGEEERPRYLYKIPDIEEEMFRVTYGREHPSVVAAREFAQRSMAGLREREREREAARRLDDDLERFAKESLAGDLLIDVPFEEDFFHEDDIPWEEDEEGMEFSRPSRIKQPISVREEFYQYPAFDPEELERFFDVERYPPSPPRGPPPGREQLHPDLWELEDPWATCGRCPQPDVSDLMRFDSP